MQNSLPPLAGEFVRVRRALWRVVDLRPYDRCRLFTLAGAGPAHAGLIRRVLAPFDAVEPAECRFRPTFVRARAWRRACRALIADHASPGALRSARHARLDVLPYQLEPALALVRGLGSRVLLADDVGLGKTIEAGLIVAELQARGAAERALILTPPGLRDQWAAELLERFGIDATVIDVTAVRLLGSTLPVGANPWATTPVVIASIDYVKRPEVLPSLLSCWWDIVIVDEAHNAAADSDRHGAVAALASRAAFVVLMTATPHNGDRRMFQSLCGIGAVSGDSLLVFRRTRRDVRLGMARRVHRLHVKPSEHERRMHALLAAFSGAVGDEHGHAAALALSVLHKRALSSPHALARTVARRLAALCTEPPADTQQLSLPIADSSGESVADDEAPAWPAQVGLQDATRERQLLTALESAAVAAARHESKMAALHRLLRRAGEPAIVFTEYRDTLLHLAGGLDRPALLHGWLTRDERRTALDSFARGNRTVLLATDAGSEGLNLHHACRVVINLELPWNPMRLEQRIGRVDRIGQRRTVHAFHLIAAGTGEALILERLKARVASAQRDIAAADPLGAAAEERVARLVVNSIIGQKELEGGLEDGVEGGFGNAAVPEATSEEMAGHARIEPQLTPEARSEADRLALARRMTVGGDQKALARIERRCPSVLVATRSRTRRQLGGRLLLLWHVSFEDGCGRPIASTVVPLLHHAGPGREPLPGLLRRLDATYPPARRVHGRRRGIRTCSSAEGFRGCADRAGARH